MILLTEQELEGWTSVTIRTLLFVYYENFGDKSVPYPEFSVLNSTLYASSKEAGLLRNIYLLWTELPPKTAGGIIPVVEC